MVVLTEVSSISMYIHCRNLFNVLFSHDYYLVSAIFYTSYP